MSSTAAQPPYRFQLRVYWEDTDAGGVVFYANYLKFFERARTEWLRSLGHAQERLRVETGAVFVVTDTTLRYLRPARLDDVLAVTVRVVHAGRAQMTLAQQAWRQVPGGEEELLTEGTIRIGCVDAGTFRPQRIPNSIVESVTPMTPTTPIHQRAERRAAMGNEGATSLPLPARIPSGDRPMYPSDEGFT